MSEGKKTKKEAESYATDMPGFVEAETVFEFQFWSPPWLSDSNSAPLSQILADKITELEVCKEAVTLPVYWLDWLVGQIKGMEAYIGDEKAHSLNRAEQEEEEETPSGRDNPTYQIQRIRIPLVEVQTIELPQSSVILSGILHHRMPVLSILCNPLLPLKQRHICCFSENAPIKHNFLSMSYICSMEDNLFHKARIIHMFEGYYDNNIRIKM